MLRFRSLITHALGALAVLSTLAGCLPEDRILSLQVSPDGRKLASISARKGLRVLWLDLRRSRTIVEEHVCSPAFAWDDGSKKLAYVSDAAHSYDICLTDLDGLTTQITTSLTQQDSPVFLPDGELLFLSTPRGRAELWRWKDKMPASRRLLALPSDIVHPVLSPEGERLAFFCFESLCPQIYLHDLKTSKTTRLTSESTPLELLCSQLAWTPDGKGLLFSRRDKELSGNGYTPLPHRSVCMLRLSPSKEQLLVSDAMDDEPFFVSSDQNSLFTLREGRLRKHSLQNGSSKSLVFGGFRVSQPCLTPTGRGIAFAAGDQLLALTGASLDSPRLLAYDAQDQLALAEEYLQQGKLAKSRAIYQELAQSIEHAQSPRLARFFYAANLLRLGQSSRAIAALEQIARKRQFAEEVPEAAFWQVLGYAHLLAQDDVPRARHCFELWQKSSGASREAQGSGPASALQILHAQDPRMTRLYAQALAARLSADTTCTLRQFSRLLERYTSSSAVRQEYLRALEGFDSEVYYFGLPPRPFAPSRSQRIDYFTHYLALTPAEEHPLALYQELFELCMEAGQLEQARSHLRAMMNGQTAEEFGEALSSMLEDYLERPEDKPWLENTMRKVLLDAPLRAEIEKHLEDAPHTRLLLQLAALKSALAQGSLNQVRLEAEQAEHLLAETTPSAQEVSHQALLIALRGCEAEKRSQWSEATHRYEEARQILQAQQGEELESSTELAFRAAMIRDLSTSAPGLLARLIRIEEDCGNELLTRAWAPAKLERAAGRLKHLHDSLLQEKATTAPRALAACLLGGVALRLKCTELARAAFLEALQNSEAPAYVRQKALLELAAIDEDRGDLWTSAKWHAQLEKLNQVTEYERHWSAFHRARLQLRLGFRVQEARDTLSVLVSVCPGSALATRAQELLDSR